MDNNKIFNINKLSNKTKEVLLEAYRLMEKDKIDIKKSALIFEYIQKAENNIWRKKNRNYYLHNIPLETVSMNSQLKENILKDKCSDTEKHAIQNTLLRKCFEILKTCTKCQRKRFLMYNYYGMSLTEIADKENVSINAVKKSLRNVDKKLIN